MRVSGSVIRTPKEVNSRKRRLWICVKAQISDILLSDITRQECGGLGEGLRAWGLESHIAGQNPSSTTAWPKFLHLQSELVTEPILWSCQKNEVSRSWTSYAWQVRLRALTQSNSSYWMVPALGGALPFQCWACWVSCRVSCSHPGGACVLTLHFDIHQHSWEI